MEEDIWPRPLSWGRSEKRGCPFALPCSPASSPGPGSPRILVCLLSERMSVEREVKWDRLRSGRPLLEETSSRPLGIVSEAQERLGWGAGEGGEQSPGCDSPTPGREPEASGETGNILQGVRTRRAWGWVLWRWWRQKG